MKEPTDRAEYQVKHFLFSPGPAQTRPDQSVTPHSTPDWLAGPPVRSAVPPCTALYCPVSSLPHHTPCPCMVTWVLSAEFNQNISLILLLFSLLAWYGSYFGSPCPPCTLRVQPARPVCQHQDRASFSLAGGGEGGAGPVAFSDHASRELGSQEWDGEYNNSQRKTGRPPLLFVGLSEGEKWSREGALSVTSRLAR